MKQNKLPGFSTGLIALAVNSAYADIVITPSDDNQHAVIINSDTVNKKVSNSIVYTNSNSSYGVSVSDVGVEATIENSLIVTSGGKEKMGLPPALSLVSMVQQPLWMGLILYIHQAIIQQDY